MTKIPFLLLGDGPAEPTGLGRIARDLAGQLLTSDLPLDLVQVGGSLPPVWTQWRHVPLDREDDWGARNVVAIYQSIWGETPGVLFAVWDPARLYAYTQIDLPAQKWAYVAIDGANWRDRIAGPARAAIEGFDRVLAYTRYGADILAASTGAEYAYLPHGISTSTYSTPSTPREQAWAAAKLGPHAIGKVVLGCVMANQARKDFGILFQTIRLLRDEGVNAYLWLHTDQLVKDWAVQQLVEDCGLAKLVTVTGLDQPLSDRQMACLYQRCEVTLLPSLGEGFGYPIVESLASGRPCVHTQWAAGEALVPRVEWKVPVRESRLDSVYAIKRPVMRAEDWRNASLRALKWRQEEGLVGEEYCKGAASHLDWSAIWGRWAEWFREGLR